MENPVFALEGQLQRVNSAGEFEAEKKPEGQEKGRDYENLRELLIKCECTHTKDRRRCWPDQILRRIMTPERVVEELQRLREEEPKRINLFQNHDIDWYLRHILRRTETEPDIEHGAENALVGEKKLDPLGEKKYMKIFAILVLCEKTKYLECFINAGLCDNKLPLEFNAITGKPFGCTSAEAQCFDKWKPAAADAFAKAQYELLVPYFGLPYSRNGVKPIIRHAKYRTEAIFPWIDLEKRCEGGFGEITCIRIHSASHGFHNVEQVQAANFELALKHMKSDDITNFENESKMLKLFSNHHEHIVKLLMSFSVADQNYLLFPWAGYDLGNYWENNNAPFDLTTNTMDRPKMQWLSAQILGLVSAVHTLHNPPHLDSLSPEAKKYARHGDIKPQNVLWFKTSSRPEGIFVIGDLGIASVHRLISRSNIPNHALPCSPDYRPPECDQEGGIISRAYDIWTLGCLLLEMICWALGGEKLRKEFEDSRMLVTYIGVMSNIFFDVKRALDGSAAILVKEVVIEQMEKLHEHEGCTEYFHDLLDIIHDSMIVVLSKTTERIRSKELHANIQILNGRMTNPAYGVVPKPRKRKYSAPIAVKTELNDFGKSRFEKFHAKLEPYDARAEEAKTAYEMRRMD